MALTANREVNHYVDQELRTFAVAGSAHVYKGAFVGLGRDGYVRGLTAGDRVCGIAYEEIDNSSGSDGDLTARVYTLGDFALPLTGVAGGDRLKPVYASDDQTLSLTAGPKSSFVGRVIDVPSTDEAIVRLGELGELPADDSAEQIEYFEDFIGAALNVTDGDWATVDLGDATQGLVSGVHGGEFALAAAATSEAEQAVLYHGDNENFDIDSKLILECRAKVVTPGTGVTVVLGVAGDHNATKDDIAAHAWFRLEAGLALMAETDDGFADNDDVDLSTTLVSGTYYTFRIDLTNTQDVKFYVDGVRVGAGTTFNMQVFGGRLQPYFSVSKASGTGTGTLTVDWVKLSATRA
ncbi:MAG: hypothetical protein GY778_23455 [bacterium]|nr:hypothetical protein [bacterium]